MNYFYLNVTISIMGLLTSLFLKEWLVAMLWLVILIQDFEINDLKK